MVACEETAPDVQIMTDSEVIGRVLSVLDPTVGLLHGLHRRGHLLVGLPSERAAAARALQLYQPQRRLAQGVVTGLKGLMRVGLQRWVLSKVDIAAEAVEVFPVLSGIDAGSCGVLLGSPEHRVRRAIASYLIGGGWEVAKVAFGDAGAKVLEQEANALVELQSLVTGVPRLLGLHRAPGLTLLRMPYLTGKVFRAGEFAEAIDLLGGWITDQPQRRMTTFPEWEAIEAALSGWDGGKLALARLSEAMLTPVICHGDFARWNILRRPDGSLVLLDWEWGHRDGLPGIDLVHYFLQDARLVMRLSSNGAIQWTQAALSRPSCCEYLRRTGWGDDLLLPMIASLAYKQGAGHQDNQAVLETLVAMAG